MSDAVLSLVLIAVLAAAVAAVRFFRTLDAGFWQDAGTPLAAGLIAGLFFSFVTDHYAAIGVVLTVAALYVRLTGRESEPSDGMLLGALTGAAAALPLAFRSGDECIRFAECIAAGAVSGFGITWAIVSVRRKPRQIALDALTAAAALGVSAAIRFSGIDPRKLALAVTIAVPLLGVLSVFKQWRDVRRELGDEASLGFLDPADVGIVAHPFRRLGAAGWADAGARREFVRIANRIALRKHQIRHRPEAEARIYQLEIIKLRMQLQEMSRIDAEVRRSSQLRSDTMTGRQA
jgi:hypothetical protein